MKLDPRLIQNIDIYGPESRPFCARCIDPFTCPRLGGCCWPAFRVRRRLWWRVREWLRRMW